MRIVENNTIYIYIYIYFKNKIMLKLNLMTGDPI